MEEEKLKEREERIRGLEGVTLSIASKEPVVGINILFCRDHQDQCNHQLVLRLQHPDHDKIRRAEHQALIPRGVLQEAYLPHLQQMW